jgi:hypothetical protein
MFGLVAASCSIMFSQKHFPPQDIQKQQTEHCETTKKMGISTSNYKNTKPNATTKDLAGLVLNSTPSYSIKLFPKHYTAEVSGPLSMSVVDPSNTHYINSFLEKYKILARYMGIAPGGGRVG